MTLLVALAVVLAGCSAPLQTGTGMETDATTISVSATGTANAEADLAVVSLTVEATADTADDARAQVATGVADVRSALADAGVSAENVTTTGYGISPVYDFSNGNRTLRGYQAAHSLAVEVAPDRAGEAIDVAVGAGATRVDGVAFTLTDERRAELRATALDRAMAAARTDADGIADATDLSVTGVESASTSADYGPYPLTRVADESGGTVLTPAPVSVSVSVSVTYRAN